MEIERRGKYAGVKVHLDKDEVEQLVENPTNISLKLQTKLKAALKSDPGLLKDRTPEEIHATLSKEAAESKLKLEAIGKGIDWKKIKVQVNK